MEIWFIVIEDGKKILLEKKFLFSKWKHEFNYIG